MCTRNDSKIGINNVDYGTLKCILAKCQCLREKNENWGPWRADPYILQEVSRELRSRLEGNDNTWWKVKVTCQTSVPAAPILGVLREDNAINLAKEVSQDRRHGERIYSKWRSTHMHDKWKGKDQRDPEWPSATQRCEHRNEVESHDGLWLRTLTHNMQNGSETK